MNKQGASKGMNLARNILTTFSARVAILAVSLVSSIVLARMLGSQGLGLLTLVLLLPELVQTFSLLGFEQANAVYAGLEPKVRRALVWQSAVIGIVVGSSTAIAGIWFLASGVPGAQAVVHGPLWLYVLPLSVIPGVVIVEYWGSILRGMNHILLLNLVSVGTRVMSLALVLALVGWLRLGVAGAVWASWLMNVGSVILLVILLGHVGVLGKPVFDRSLLRRTTRFALPAYCSTVLTYLNNRVDQLIIGLWLPPEHLGFYVIAVGLAERLWILTGAVANALLPHLTNSRERDPVLAAVIARHVIMWTGFACLLIFWFADLIIRVLYSSEFVQAAAPLRWLLPGIFIATAGKVVIAEILAREKIYFTVWVTAVTTLVNIGGNLVLLPRMGISGAALASTISYSLLSFIVSWYYLRETGLSWRVLVPRQSDLLVYAALWRRSVRAISLGIGTP